MIKIDSDGLLLCKIQAELFEKSLDNVKTSSLIFIRRFMNSKIAYELDTKDFLNSSKSIYSIYEDLEAEYGKSEYGKTLFNGEVMYWIGYLYRYFSYTYNLTSKQVFKMVKPNELNEMYYIYHTFDCANAIERILEEKNIDLRDDTKNDRLLEILRRHHYEERVELKEISDKNLYLSERVDAKYNDKPINTTKQSINIDYNDNLIGKIDFNTNDNKFSFNIYNAKYNNPTMYQVILKRAIDYAKNNLHKNSLSISVRNENEGFIKILEKNGFKSINEYKYLTILEKNL